MAVSSNYLTYVLEQLAGLGDLSSRRMFGAIGLYCDDLFFGIIDNDTVFFKVDDSNRPDYEARDMSPFCPFADRPDVSMTYFEVPADALEDATELKLWARKSVTVALKSAKEKPRRARSRPKAKRPTRKPRKR